MTKPKSLAEIRDNSCELGTAAMNDRLMCPQVHEATNAYGKAIGACKVYLEAAALTETKPSGTWKEFLLGQ